MDRKIPEVANRLIRGMPNNQQGRARLVYYHGFKDAVEALDLALAENAAQGEPMSPMAVVDQFIKVAKE